MSDPFRGPVAGRTLLLIIPIMLLLTVACAPANTGVETTGESAGAAGRIAVTLQEWSVVAVPSSAPAGDVAFEVSNQGALLHNFVVFATALAPDALPVKNGQVVGSDGVKEVGRIDELSPGSTKRLSLVLEAGSYVLICNEPGHYQQGMHLAFSVGP